MPKNKDILLHKENSILYCVNLTLTILSFFIYCSSYANFPNCPNGISYNFCVILIQDPTKNHVTFHLSYLPSLFNLVWFPSLLSPSRIGILKKYLANVLKNALILDSFLMIRFRLNIFGAEILYRGHYDFCVSQIAKFDHFGSGGIYKMFPL